jgi:hypothetical protein
MVAPFQSAPLFFAAMELALVLEKLVNKKLSYTTCRV